MCLLVRGAAQRYQTDRVIGIIPLVAALAVGVVALVVGGLIKISRADQLRRRIAPYVASIHCQAWAAVAPEPSSGQTP